MKLVERHIIKKENCYYDICAKAKCLYNISLYYWRQSIFGSIQYFTEYELSGLFAEFNQEDYRNLPAQTSQQIIKNLFKNIKSWQKSRREYEKNPFKFLGKPNLPKYKKETSIVFFTKQQLVLKDGMIHFPKRTNIPPLKTKVNNVAQVRIIPNSNHFIIEVVYNNEELKIKPYNGKWMSLDLGVNNLVSLMTDSSAFLINGKSLKAINHFYNKKKANLQSYLPKNKFNSKRITILSNRRKQKLNDKIHKISKQIVDIAQNQNITRIIIGNNKNWKQNINIGKENNKTFTYLPHSVLIDKIKYKGLMRGIEVIKTQEAYTSKCSALDLEPIQKHSSYKGRRIKRGLFRTEKGLKINADLNGALNIARLVSGNEIISNSVRSVVSTPKVINNFNTNYLHN